MPDVRERDHVSSVPPNLRDSVSGREALTVDCPLCGRLAGKRCVYMADKWSGSRLSYREGHIVIPKGTETVRAHNPRLRVFAEQRLTQWRKEHKAEAAKLGAARSRQLRALWPAMAAEAEFDRREREMLRGWLREFGHVLWDTRPDGTWRGDSYAAGGAAL